ncbi:MAG: hypothetical protein QGG42_18450 [Phycisphaerae bacterium]|jgi:hypothetical protein|nr:hypothetical protein [Phycisphaerae bacterium]
MVISKLNIVVVLSIALVVICNPPAGVAAPKKAPAPGSQIDRIVNDWMLQDHGKDVKKCFTAASGCDIEAKMVEKVLSEAPNAKLTGEMNSLVKSKTPGKDPRWKKLYISACAARRAARLKSLNATTRRIVFTKHYNMGASHYAYTEGLSDAQAERHFIPGTALCVLEIDGTQTKVTTLIDDSNGVIRDPDVSYDGKRILFSWKKSDRKDDYHLYEMDVATKKIRQLTSGLGHADYEGVYLPNGNILFNSTRCVQTVDCWWTEVSNFYIVDKDGKLMRRVGFDQVHTNYPQVLADGRVIYTRWDYNDRGQLYPQPLYQMNIDGTAQTEYYGNNSWFPTTIGHARGIPGSDKILAIATGHHSIQTGALILIDVKQGRQETQGVTLVAPLVADKKDRRYRRVDGYTGFNGHFQYPYPISETEYVSAYSAHQTRRRSKDGYGIYYVRQDAARELLVDDPKISCNQPVFLMARKRPPVRPSVVDYKKKTGTYYVQDVYFGPGLKGIERGVVKKLRVVSIGFRAAGVHSNGNGGPGGGALVSTPIAIRNGTWDTKTVIGEAKVHTDGSAFFEAPARTPLYFQLIDGDGYVVQSMRSWSTLMPGENFACIGCHEDKNATSPPTKTTLAMKAGPKPLKEFYGKPVGFSYPKMIQPILDKHCIKCHMDRSKSPKTKSRGRGPVSKLNLAKAKPLLPKCSKWRYTTTKPKSDWMKPGFDDGKWKLAAAGFGTSNTPGGKKNSNWNTPTIWMRTNAELAGRAKDSFRFVVCHDEDVEIYVNGVLAASAGGYVTDYVALKLSDKGLAALKAGKNSIAVRCRQTSGGQYIDVALYDTKPGAAAAPPKVIVAKPAKGDPEIKKAFSLLGETHSSSGGRKWSDSYIYFTQNGRPNEMVKWMNVQSIPPMLPPYFAGSKHSKLMTILKKGHGKTKLSTEELEKIACWIDLLVPYCGDYMEANSWDAKGIAKYKHFQKKRDDMAAIELQNVKILADRK